METITFYYRASCPHSRLVEAALRNKQILYTLIDLNNSDPETLEQLKSITGGYLSVPTLVFPDGKSLVEPSVTTLMNTIKKQYPHMMPEGSKSFFSFLKKKGQS